MEEYRAMKHTFFLFPLLALFILPSAHAAGGPLIFLSSKAPLQGDALVVTFKGKAGLVRSATFGAAPIKFFDYRSSSRTVIPIDATKKPGTYLLRVRYTDGTLSERSILVRAKKFPRVTFDVPPQLGLSSLALVEKLAEKKSVFAQITSSTSLRALFSNPFRFPLADHSKIGSPFGELRNSGDTTIRHLGADFTAPLDATVTAINSGVVRKAYLDSLYGNSVLIDHGSGISSLYLHLNEFRVHPGEHVSAETVIGTVGQTGYASAPHLHLSVKLSGTSVDPIQFITAFK